MGNRLNSVLVASAVLVTASMFSPVAAEETASKALEVVAEITTPVATTPVATTPVATETAQPRAAAVDEAPMKAANPAVGYAKASVRPATHRPRRAAYRSATHVAWSFPPSRPHRTMFLGIGY